MTLLSYHQLLKRFDWLAQFELDRQDPIWDAYIENDRLHAMELGVNALPTYFINGIRVDGANPAKMKMLVDLHL